MKKLALYLLPLAIVGCATAPRPLQGEFAAVRPLDAARAEGERVRWGGSVISVETRPGETCFEVLGRDLSGSARPLPTDASDGRFLACRGGFYDPAIFEAGREITVTGSVQGSEVRKVGEFAYTYPRVNADTVYLWPERSDVIIEHRSGPFFYGYPYGFGLQYRGIYHRPYYSRHYRGHHGRPKSASSSGSGGVVQAQPRSPVSATQAR